MAFLRNERMPGNPESYEFPSLHSWLLIRFKNSNRERQTLSFYNARVSSGVLACADASLLMVSKADTLLWLHRWCPAWLDGCLLSFWLVYCCGLVGGQFGQKVNHVVICNLCGNKSWYVGPDDTAAWLETVSLSQAVYGCLQYQRHILKLGTKFQSNRQQTILLKNK